METEKEMEMEMEGMSWKALFQRRVVMADAHCRNADSLLHGLAVRFMEREARDMVACGAAEEARRALEGASAQLGLAVANMGAARHLTLRCGCRRAGAVDPDSDPSPSTPPPPSPSSSSVADPEARRALALLREASELVFRVHDLVEGARGHLGAAESLLLALGLLGEDHDGSAPWVHPPCVAEQLDGVMDLGEAFSQALHLVALTTAAREAAFGIGDY